MGQHKHPGASMTARGLDYRKEQRKRGGMPRFYDDHAPGRRFRTRDGRWYRVASDGSYRRVGKVPT